MKYLILSFVALLVLISILFLIFSYNNVVITKYDTYYLITAEKDILPRSATTSSTSLSGYYDKSGAYVLTNVSYAFGTHLDIFLRVKAYVNLPSGYSTIREFYSLSENQSVSLNTTYCEIYSISLSPVGAYLSENFLYSSAEFKYPSDVSFIVNYNNNTFVDVINDYVGDNTLVVPVDFSEIFQSMTAVYRATLYFKPVLSDTDTELGRIIEVLDYYIIEYPTYIFMYVENFYNLLRG